MGAAEVSGMPRLGKAKTGHSRGYYSGTKPVQLWNGSNGKMGYFSYLVQHRTWVIAQMLGLILKHNPRMKVPPPKNAEPISQRAELEGRGVNLRYFLNELITRASAKNRRELYAELRRGGTEFDESMVELIDELWSERLRDEREEKRKSKAGTCRSNFSHEPGA
ncbi:MAG TPA: hypothetical protein VIJ04_25160 [Xanthobacteraceae bacterium]